MWYIKKDGLDDIAGRGCDIFTEMDWTILLEEDVIYLQRWTGWYYWMRMWYIYKEGLDDITGRGCDFNTSLASLNNCMEFSDVKPVYSSTKVSCVWWCSVAIACAAVVLNAPRIFLDHNTQVCFGCLFAFVRFFFSIEWTFLIRASQNSVNIFGLSHNSEKGNETKKPTYV